MLKPFSPFHRFWPLPVPARGFRPPWRVLCIFNCLCGMLAGAWELLAAAGGPRELSEFPGGSWRRPTGALLNTLNLIYLNAKAIPPIPPLSAVLASSSSRHADFGRPGVFCVCLIVYTVCSQALGSSWQRQAAPGSSRSFPEDPGGGPRELSTP